ncbi:protein arginine methyltransferase NDUFAF7 homolog, mitochondrial [Sitodiplosis mosellana]|uniref:protein arginine methyltransferase NDUFAF7 homolog, mitochondrial n=1 Tax=Sitodiplosis mosellana TaxID=263140 RepID=UPI002443EA3D|nr:protein arginine methyltransferase NDUFAF7 homolog, mitochondrial [Sitodiplosis mosellana]
MQVLQRIFAVQNTKCLRGMLRHFCYKPIKRPTLNIPAKSRVAAQADAEKNQSLSNVLKTLISATGPISVAEYMKHVLTNPNSGYYMLKDVFGEKGDFITSPEISQIFAELVAIWCLSEWQKCGSPGPLQVVELGPGRGTLSQDILRVFAQFGLSDKFSLHLVEVSPYLSELQAKRLCCQHTETKKGDLDSVPYYRKGESVSGIEIFWYREIKHVPKSFSIFLAHEFFDALPIHKFHRTDDNSWQEILIDTDKTEENHFRFVTSNAKTTMLGLFLTRPWIDKDVQLPNDIEYSAETEQTIDVMANRIEENGGFALIMDYGHSGEKGDTFRAFKNHKLHNPLVDPGTADVTADVNFAHIKMIAEHNNRVVTYGPIEQKDFLSRMGGETRLKNLMDKAASTNDANLLKSGYDMLTEPLKMGSRFKFFAMFPKILENHLKKFPVNGFSVPSNKIMFELMRAFLRLCANDR